MDDEEDDDDEDEEGEEGDDEEGGTEEEAEEYDGDGNMLHDVSMEVMNQDSNSMDVERMLLQQQQQ